MTTDGLQALKPGNKVIRISCNGMPFIEGFRCPACAAVVADQTLACRACGSRNLPEPFRAAETGKLFSWSVVERSYPGVAVPFVSAIVDLDDALTIKGTLVSTNAASLKQGMPIRVVFDDAGGAHDKDGAPYAGFHFVVVEGAE